MPHFGGLEHIGHGFFASVFCFQQLLGAAVVGFGIRQIILLRPICFHQLNGFAPECKFNHSFQPYLNLSFGGYCGLAAYRHSLVKAGWQGLFPCPLTVLLHGILLIYRHFSMPAYPVAARLSYLRLPEKPEHTDNLLTEPLLRINCQTFGL